MPNARHRARERSRRAPGWSVAAIAALALTLSLVVWLQREPSGPALSPAASADGASTKTARPQGAARVRIAWTTPVSRSGARPRGEKMGPVEVAVPVARAQAESAARASLELQRRAKVARIKARKRREWRAKHAPFTVHIATFNVLGSQHSMKGGSHPSFPPAGVRTARAAGYIARHGADIVGTQELQADQLRQLTGATGMAAYPGFGWGEKETDNSILYDPGDYEYVSGDTYYITFVHRTRPQPILRLRDRDTGREFYVINTHTTPGAGASMGERHRAHATTSSLVRRLHAETGLPVLLTGDMNDREQFYCRVVATGGMSTPQGGSYSGGCRPPAGHLAVDWVAGVGVDGWSDYWMDQSSVANKTSDHFVVSAVAHIGGAD